MTLGFSPILIFPFNTDLAGYCAEWDGVERPRSISISLRKSVMSSPIRLYALPSWSDSPGRDAVSLRSFSSFKGMLSLTGRGFLYSPGKRGPLRFQCVRGLETGCPPEGPEKEKKPWRLHRGKFPPCGRTALWTVLSECWLRKRFPAKPCPSAGLICMLRR